MILEHNDISRYAIYVFYDPSGIADEYNFYFLNDLKKNIDRLMIICNGAINVKGLRRFEEIADEVIVRDNEGLDVTAYKFGLFKYGADYLDKYDEVLILNSTNFGPFYPFNNMLEDMKMHDVDFWGIASFSGVSFDPFGTIEYGYIPEHIQSHFMVFRKSIFKSQCFIEFWKNLPKIHSYEEAIGYFEAIFTKKFADKGYKWDVYLDCPELKGHAVDILRDYPEYLIKEKKCPIIKRRSFFHEYREALSRTCGESTLDAFEFVKKNLSYDVDMIWDNILRLQNLADIKKRMHLNYVLDSHITTSTNNNYGKVALILHIYYVDLAGYCLEYIKSMPEKADIYVTVKGEKEKEIIERKFADLQCNKLEVRVIKNRGRDVSALLVGCKDIISNYDYICFVHDKKVAQIEPRSIGESWGYRCFENLLGSKAFVCNILNTFVENKKLGMLTPPPPNHSVYYPTLGAMEWGNNFENTKKLAKKLQLRVDLNEAKEPVAPLGSFFWFRTKAMETLFEQEWKYEDFPEEPLPVNGTISHAIERIYPFVAQHNRYYSATMLSSEFAKIELTNLNFINNTLNKDLFKRYGKHSHLEIVDCVKNSLKG